jgi:hypothetical protein
MTSPRLPAGLARMPCGYASAMPDLRRGYCQPPHAVLDTGSWPSLDPRLRELAVRECRACPVLGRCETWAITPQWQAVWSSPDWTGVTAAAR